MATYEQAALAWVNANKALLWQGRTDSVPAGSAIAIAPMFERAKHMNLPSPNTTLVIRIDWDDGTSTIHTRDVGQDPAVWFKAQLAARGMVGEIP